MIFDILVGCEESQAVANAFRALGQNAYSCDLKPCSGGHPEYHLQTDVLDAIKLKRWHMCIFFPDCTFLTNSAEWCYKDQPPLKSGKLVGAARREARKKAITFVKKLYNCNISHVGIENPIGVLSTAWQKPDQIIQPFEFGHPESKSTCLWLKDLPLIRPTKFAEFKKYRCVCVVIYSLLNTENTAAVLNGPHVSYGIT